MSVVYLVRHGQSQANLTRVWGGDLPLTEKGIAQAKEVSGKLPERPDKVVSSMLQRVYATAITAYPDLEIEKNPAFNEVNFGSMELKGMTAESLDFYHNDPEGYQKAIGGDDLRQRGEDAVREIQRYAAENETTVIFLSNTLLKSIITVIEGKTFMETRGYYTDNCSVITLFWDGALHITDAGAIRIVTSWQTYEEYSAKAAKTDI